MIQYRPNGHRSPAGSIGRTKSDLRYDRQTQSTSMLANAQNVAYSKARPSDDTELRPSYGKSRSTNSSSSSPSYRSSNADRQHKTSSGTRVPPSSHTRSTVHPHSSNSTMAKKRKRFDQIVALTNSAGASYSTLAIIQHCIALLKHNPRFAQSFGLVDILLVQSSISNYRNFVDLRGVLNHYGRAKTHHKTHRGISTSDLHLNSRRALGGASILSALCWAGFDSATWLSSLNILRHSTDPLKQAAFTRKMNQTAYKFKFTSHVFNYARHIAEEYADRKLERSRKQRKLSHAQARAEAEDIRKRRHARVKAAFVDTLWVCIAIANFSYKRRGSMKMASVLNIILHTNALRDLWKLAHR